MSENLDPVEVGRVVAELQIERDDARRLVADCFDFLVDLGLWLRPTLPIENRRSQLVDLIRALPWIEEV